MKKIGQPEKRVNQKFKIQIIPDNFIVFQCEEDQPAGQIRIIIKNLSSEVAEPCYELMCTNKQNYKVSNSKAKLEKNGFTFIRIYIKNIDNLQRCLRDKFRIRIFDESKPTQTLYEAKMKVLIEKNKKNSKVDDFSNNITQTASASRTTSVYTSPSIYTNPSLLGSTTASDIKSIVYLSRLIAQQQKGISPLNSKLQSLYTVKDMFDQSSKKCLTKEKQLKIAEGNYQKNKAKQKFCVGVLIFCFLLSILFGFLFKKFMASEIYEDTVQYIKGQFFN